MKSVVYPGSFDPITLGHLDIMERSAKVFDKVIVAVLDNVNKDYFFSKKERIEMVEALTKNYDNIEVCSFDGLLINFMQEIDSNIIIKGLRLVNDFEYENNMANMNSHLTDGQIETVLMISNPKYSFISSSSVREILHFGGDITGLVPDVLVEYINKRFRKNGGGKQNE